VLATSCPKRMLTAEVFAFIDLADWADEKYLPVTGGVLDQTESFLSALREWRGMVHSWRNK